jgi:integrase
MNAWKAKGLASKSINNIASIYRIMLGEAERLEIIGRSPWAKVQGLYAGAGGKGILTLDEYKALMDPTYSNTARWIQDIYYTINLLASVTGLRMGECLALHPTDVHADHITVSHSWSIKYGEGSQKTKRGTDQIPIPASVAERLQILAEGKPGGNYIFSLGDGLRPCTASRVDDALYRALGEIGIDKIKRKERRIAFHSWRAFANTYFRSSGVPDAKVREITRHASKAMTEHYSVWRLEDFPEVVKAQASLMESIFKSPAIPIKRQPEKTSSSEPIPTIDQTEPPRDRLKETDLIREFAHILADAARRMEEIINEN